MSDSDDSLDHDAIIDEMDFGTVTLESELPIAYKDMNNTEEDIICMIGRDVDDDGVKQSDQYVAMFINKTTKERKSAYLEDLKHVDRFRNGLCLKGWRLVKPPKINTGQYKQRSRQQRREEERASKKLEKTKKKRQQAVKTRKQKLQEELQRRRAFAESLKTQS